MPHDAYLKQFQLNRPWFGDYDFVIVDEEQDISPVMLSLILNGGKESKTIFCGDPYQSIYSFRGAVGGSLGHLIANYDPQVFYLSISFRCPPKIARLANRVLMMAGATEEFVGAGNPASTTSQRAYIARTNAGLFDFLVENLDKKIFFVGGIASYDFQNMRDILSLVGKKHEWIKNDFIASFAGIAELRKYAENSRDVGLLAAIGTVFKHIENNIPQILKALKEASTTNVVNADLVVSTSHRSKGLEWENVTLLEDFPFPFKEDMDEAQKMEELRLLYVAITRSKSSIILPDNIQDLLS